MPKTLSHYISGATYGGSPVTIGAVINPATEEVIANVPYASATDIDYATRKALEAFDDWQATPAAARAKILMKWRYLIEQHQDELADVIGQEHGKSKVEALGSISRGLDVLEFACGIPTHLMGGV